MDNLIKQNKIVLSCFYIKKNFKKKLLRGWTVQFLPPVRAVQPWFQGFMKLTKIWFFMLKKSVFIPVLDFHGPTSWSGPSLKTLPAWALSQLECSLDCSFISIHIISQKTNMNSEKFLALFGDIYLSKLRIVSLNF